MSKDVNVGDLVITTTESLQMTPEGSEAVVEDLLVFSDESGKEVFRITPDKEMVFAEDVTPQDAAKAFAEWFGQYANGFIG